MLDTILGLIICGVLLYTFISGGLKEVNDENEDGSLVISFIEGAMNESIIFGLCLIGWMVSLGAFICGLKLVF